MSDKGSDEFETLDELDKDFIEEIKKWFQSLYVNNNNELVDEDNNNELQSIYEFYKDKIDPLEDIDSLMKFIRGLMVKDDLKEISTKQSSTPINRIGSLTNFIKGLIVKDVIKKDDDLEKNLIINKKIYDESITC